MPKHTQKPQPTHGTKPANSRLGDSAAELRSVAMTAEVGTDEPVRVQTQTTTINSAQHFGSTKATAKGAVIAQPVSDESGLMAMGDVDESGLMAMGDVFDAHSEAEEIALGQINTAGSHSYTFDADGVCNGFVTALSPAGDGSAIKAKEVTEKFVNPVARRGLVQDLNLEFAAKVNNTTKSTQPGAEASLAGVVARYDEKGDYHVNAMNLGDAMVVIYHRENHTVDVLPAREFSDHSNNTQRMKAVNLSEARPFHLVSQPINAKQGDIVLLMSRAYWQELNVSWKADRAMDLDKFMHLSAKEQKAKRDEDKTVYFRDFAINEIALKSIFSKVLREKGVLTAENISEAIKDAVAKRIAAFHDAYRYLAEIYSDRSRDTIDLTAALSHPLSEVLSQRFVHDHGVQAKFHAIRVFIDVLNSQGESIDINSITEAEFANKVLTYQAIEKQFGGEAALQVAILPTERRELARFLVESCDEDDALTNNIVLRILTHFEHADDLGAELRDLAQENVGKNELYQFEADEKIRQFIRVLETRYVPEATDASKATAVRFVYHSSEAAICRYAFDAESDLSKTFERLDGQENYTTEHKIAVLDLEIVKSRVYLNAAQQVNRMSLADMKAYLAAEKAVAESSAPDTRDDDAKQLAAFIVEVINKAGGDKEDAVEATVKGKVAKELASAQAISQQKQAERTALDTAAINATPLSEKVLLAKVFKVISNETVNELFEYFAAARKSREEAFASEVQNSDMGWFAKRSVVHSVTDKALTDLQQSLAYYETDAERYAVLNRYADKHNNSLAQLLRFGDDTLPSITPDSRPNVKRATPPRQDAAGDDATREESVNPAT